MPTTGSKVPINWKHELPVLAALFLDLTAFGMVFPHVQLHAHDLGARGPVIGLLLASMFAVQMLVSPAWGSLSDRVGRKPIFGICTSLSALSWLVYALSTNLWLVLASRVLAGIAAANVVVAQAYLADGSNDENRSAVMGRSGAAISTGLILGPAIGLQIAAHEGVKWLGLIAASCSAVAVACTFFMVESKRPETTARKASFAFDLSLLRQSPQLRSLVMLATIAWLALATLEGTFGRLITEHYKWPETLFGWAFSMESLIGVIVQGLLLGWIVSRLRDRWTLRIGFVLTGVGLLLTPFAPTVWLLFVFSGLYAVGSGLSNPTLNSSASRLVDEDRQGQLFGVLQGSRSIGFLVGPMIGGALFDWKAASPYVLAGSIALAAAMTIPPSAASNSS